MDSGLVSVNPDQMKRLQIAPETTCPQCKSRVVHRTKRRGILERLILYPLGFRALQCEYCLKRFLSRTKPTQPVAVAHATDAPINPIFQDSRNKREGQSLPSLVPRLLTEQFEPKNAELRSTDVLSSYSKSRFTIGVVLATVLLSSVFGFLAYYLIRIQNSPQAGDSKVAAKAPESKSNDAISSVNPSSTTTPFSPPISPLDLPGFVLQVGAMTHEEDADALAHDLQRRNYPAFVFWRRSERFYRVAVGPYRDYDSPMRVKNELEKQGLKGFLRRWVPE